MRQQDPERADARDSEIAQAHSVKTVGLDRPTVRRRVEAAIADEADQVRRPRILLDQDEPRLVLERLEPEVRRLLHEIAQRPLRGRARQAAAAQELDDSADQFGVAMPKIDEPVLALLPVLR